MIAARLVLRAFRRPVSVSGGERSQPPLRGQRAGAIWEGRVDPGSSNLSNQVTCSRCQRVPRDDADYVVWEALEEGPVCPGCLTMLELEARRTSG